MNKNKGFENMTFRWRALLAMLGGVLYFLGFVGFNIWPLSWICLVPLLFALEGVSVKRGFLLGWIFGITLTVGGFYWVAYTIHVFARMPWVAGFVGCLFLAIAQGTQIAFFGLLYSWMRKHSQVSAFILVPLTYVVAEMLSPQLFPHYLAASQYMHIPLIQISDITGILGVTALIVIVNTALFITIRDWSSKRHIDWRPLGVATSILALVLIYGVIQIRFVAKKEEGAQKLRFGIAQINMGIYEKSRNPEKAIRLFQQQTRELKQKGVDIAVWPETAINFPHIIPEEKLLPREIYDDLDIPVLTGAISEEKTDGRERLFNVGVLSDEVGSILGIYKKRKLLMLGEYIPFGERYPKLYKMMPYIGHMTPGSADQPLRFKEYLLGVNICYEDILPRLISKMMRHAPHVLVNLTNDNWFGATHEPMQHLVLAAFRSVEHRRWLVRSTNTGISAFVDATGKIRQKTPVMESSQIISDVPMLSGHTVYSRLGDWVGGLAILSIIGIRLYGRRGPPPL